MQAVKEVSLGVLTADSAEQLDLPKPQDKNHALAHELRYHWKVSAPKLDKKSKEIKQQLEKEQVSYSPPVYLQNGRNVVAIQQPQQIPSAQKLIQQGIAKAIVVRD
ncbi:MAG: hypothetical protein ABFS56_14890 [Pseudomonadota bacterium]